MTRLSYATLGDATLEAIEKDDNGALWLRLKLGPFVALAQRTIHMEIAPEMASSFEPLIGKKLSFEVLIEESTAPNVLSPGDNQTRRVFLGRSSSFEESEEEVSDRIENQWTENWSRVHPRWLTIHPYRLRRLWCVLWLKAQGKTYKEIAEAVGVTPKGVGHYINQACLIFRVNCFSNEQFIEEVKKRAPYIIYAVASEKADELFKEKHKEFFRDNEFLENARHSTTEAEMMPLSRLLGEKKR